MEEATSLLHEAESVLAVVHRRADVDSVGSAVGLEESISASVTVAVPSSVRADSEALLSCAEEVERDESEVELSEYDVVVVLDAPTEDRISPINVSQTDAPVILIDHHTPSDLAEKADVAIVDTEADATAVIVYRLLDELGVSATGDGAVGLAAGILDDTEFLSDASPESADATTDLLSRAGHSSQKLVDIFGHRSNHSERMATATAISRADGYKAGSFVLLSSRIGGEHATVADALIEAGADIAFVFDILGEEILVVGRVARRPESDIQLPTDVFSSLIEEFGGEGGGHAEAGTVTLRTSEIEEVEAACRERVEEAIGMTFGKVS